MRGEARAATCAAARRRTSSAYIARVVAALPRLREALAATRARRARGARRRPARRASASSAARRPSGGEARRRSATRRRRGRRRGDGDEEVVGSHESSRRNGRRERPEVAPPVRSVGHDRRRLAHRRRSCSCSPCSAGRRGSSPARWRSSASRVGAWLGHAGRPARAAPTGAQLAVGAGVRPGRRAARGRGASRSASRGSARACAARAALARADAPSTACSARVLTACVGLGVAWVLGALALANGGDARREVQRSAILQQLNTVAAAVGRRCSNALARLDPFPRIDGPGGATCAPPRGGDRARPAACRRRAAQRGEDPRHRVRARRRGLGLGGRRRARGHQRARRRGPERHARAAARPRARRSTRTAVAFDPRNDIAVLRVAGPAGAPALPLAADAEAGHLGGDPRLPGQRARTTCAPGGSGDDARGDHPGRLRARAGAALDRRRCAARCAPATPAGRWSTATGAWSTTVFAATTTRPARRLRRARTRSCARRCSGRARSDGRVDRALRRADPVATLRRPWARRSSSPRSRPSGATSRGRCPGAFPSTRATSSPTTHVVTWAVGHLVQLAEPDEYDAKYKKWRMADLPIVPDRFKLVVRDERSRKQMTVITQACSSATTSTRSSTPATPAARAS